MEANLKKVAGVLNAPAPHMVGDGLGFIIFSLADTKLK